jgi:hypothetical protein
MIFVRNNYRDIGNGLVIGDCVIRYTNESVSCKCAKSALSTPRFDHLANELVETNGVQREEAIVAIVIGEALRKYRNGLGIVGAEAPQRNEAAVSQLTWSREFHDLTAHRFSSLRSLHPKLCLVRPG